MRVLLLLALLLFGTSAAQPILQPTETLWPEYGANESNLFGLSVAVSERWLAVGAPRDFSSGVAEAGAVYVYEWQSGSWNRIARLDSPMPSEGASFGRSVALSGNILVVGESAYTDGGATHIYRFDDSWSLETTLIAPNTASGSFGFAVAIDDTTLAVGAPSLDDRDAPGRTYVYTHRDGHWGLRAERLPDFSENRNGYGYFIQVSTGRIAVSGGGQGEIDILEPVGSTWAWTASLKENQHVTQFHLLGDRLVTVAGRDHPANAAAIVYDYRDGVWNSSLLPLPATPLHIPQFAGLSDDKVFIAMSIPGTSPSVLAEYVATPSGWALQDRIEYNPVGDISLSNVETMAVHDEMVAIGWITSRQTFGRSGGAVSIFRPGEVARAQQPVLFPDDRPTDRYYGQAVAIDGIRLAVAAEDATSIYVLRDGHPELEAEVAGGRSVSIDQNRLLVGQPQAGRAYLYSLQNHSWRLTRSFSGPPTFGTSVAVEGGHLLIGIPGTASDTGRVQSYGSITRTLMSPDSAAGDRFGTSIDIDNHRAIIGAAGRQHSERGSGDAYLFDYIGTGWSFDAALSAPDRSRPGSFGQSVALDGGRALVGAPWISIRNDYPGAVYVFEGVQWVSTSTFSSPRGDASFGGSLSLDGNRAAIGARLSDLGFIYVYDGLDWTLSRQLESEESKALGSSVSVSGRRVMVGAPEVSVVGPFAGAAYFYEDAFTVGVDDPPSSPEQVRLGVPHPNPSTRETEFILTLDAPDEITVTVYDALGRRAGAPLSAHYGAGTHALRLNDPSLSPGLYIVQVTGETVSVSRAFTRVR